MSGDLEAKAPKLQATLADFELIRRIGDGSFSHVVLARHRATGQQYALKVIDKQYIQRHKVVEYVRRERQILDTLRNCEAVAQLHFTFQDAYSLYLGLEYCPNGELYYQIRLRGRLDDPAARFYAAEVVQMLETLRARGVVHRDLKPENLLLNEAGHLQLIDFGSAKQLENSEAAEGGAAGAAAVAAAACAAAAEDRPEEQGQQQQGRAAASAGEQGGTVEEAEDAAEAGGADLPGDGEPAATASSGRAEDDQQSEQPEQQPQEQADGALQSASGGQAGSAPEQEAEEQQGQQLEGQEESGRANTELSRRAVSLVGTADYVSPEILNNRTVSCAADLWALGCVLYQMLVGRPPFKTNSEYLTFQKIVDAEYDMPEGVSEVAADLISRLLRVEPSERIGAGDLGELKGHPFFAGIDWDTLRSQTPPEFVPDLDPAFSSANSSFDWELQSLASALPPGTAEDHLELDHT